MTRSFLMDVPIRMVCSARHRLANRRAVSWDELRDERWVIYSSEFNRHLERILQAHDTSLSMQTAAEVGYLTTALALVGVGTGVPAGPRRRRRPGAEERAAAQLRSQRALSTCSAPPSASRSALLMRCEARSISGAPAVRITRLLLVSTRFLACCAPSVRL